MQPLLSQSRGSEKIADNDTQPSDGIKNHPFPFQSTKQATNHTLSHTTIQMFFNHSAAGDSVIRGSVDENASAALRKTPHKTPTTTQIKRRAFGDISNRKQQPKANTTKTPHYVSIVPTQQKGRTTTTTRKVTFAAVSNTTTARATTSVQKSSSLVEPIEVSAGRGWRDQASFHNDEDDEAIQEILDEHMAWQREVQAFCEEERTRPMRIRQHQKALADRELEEKMEALWKQDDEGTFNVNDCCLLLNRNQLIFVVSLCDADRPQGRFGRPCVGIGSIL